MRLPPANPAAVAAALARPLRGVWKIVIAAAVPLVVDVVFPSWPTGLVATGAMAAFCATGWRSLRAVHTGRRTHIALLLGMTGFAVARALILLRQFQADGGAVAARAATTYDLAFFGLEGVLVLTRVARRRVQRLSLLLLQRPAMMLTSSFVGLIIAGALLLSMPFSVRSTADISLLDALFTATSAVCVTGLSVNDIGATYTYFGQGVILLLLQLGGIGIITISGLALNLTSGLESQARYAAMLETRDFGEMRTLFRRVVVSTLVVEAFGVVALAALWWGHPVVEQRGGAVWNALFHSVSAFTNGSFSLFPKSLEPWRANAAVQLVIMALIAIGGIGFPVLYEIMGRVRARLLRLRGLAWDPRPLSLGSRVALLVSAGLIVAGAALFALLEAGNLSRTVSAWEYTLSSFFVSVCARTAGFQTIDFGPLRPATLLVVIVLMFIGGSPGSCAGGIKTTTFAVLTTSISAELKRRESRLFSRALYPGAMRRALAVTLISVSVVFTALLLLTATERHPFLPLAFETVSAFGTVGFSTGITPALSAAGKLIIVATMFVGRVGPLTIALALSDRPERPLYRLAREDLPIG